MKTYSYFSAIAVTSVGLLLSFQKSNAVSKNITFLDAVNQGYISCQLSGAGGYSGKSVSLNLTNKSASQLTILIQPGTLFFRPTLDNKL